MSTIIKQQAIDLIAALPDNCSLEDIQYHLYVLQKVERGIQAIDEGRTLSQQEAEERVKSWFKSSGQNQPSPT
jgi:predicted transcriptional regulator